MARLRVGVLISGRGSNLEALLDAAANPSYPAEIAFVISNRAEAAGLRHADRAGVRTQVIDHKEYADRSNFDAAINAALEAQKIEIVCLAGFMRLLSREFCERWKDRLLNIHPSLLPAFKGLHVHEAVLDSGTRFSGCTVHLVRPDMDAGPIIAQAAVPVYPDDTPESLSGRILIEEHRLYPFAVRLFAEGRVSVENERVTISGTRFAKGVLFNPPLPNGTA